MKKYAIYGLLALATVGFVSCSDDEEVLVPSAGYVDNKFAVPADATGPEADLRRKFYEDNGSFLLFSDLLAHEYVGKDAYGHDVYKDEYVDFNYNLNSMSSSDPEIELLTDLDDKKAAVDLIERYVLPRIAGGQLMPFSVLPLKSILATQTSYPYDIVEAKTISCFRCLGVNVGEWLELPEEEQEGYGASVLLDLIASKFTYQSEEADEFCDLSYEYSGYYLDEIDEDWDGEDLSLVYECGFISYVKTRYGDVYLPFTYDDFNDYLMAVLTRDEVDFMEEFGEYPMIVTKYNIIKDAIIALGYKF